MDATDWVTLINRSEVWLNKLNAPAQPEIKATASIGDMVDGYTNDIGELVQNLLRGSGRLSKADFRRQMKSTIKAYAREGFSVAWEEGGGDVNETEAADIALIDEFTKEQQGFVDDFADWLTNKDSDLDQVQGRVDMWGASYQNYLEVVKLRAQGDPMLRYDGEDGAESCEECQEYKSQSHRLSWWEKRGLTKRNGNEEFTCGRWPNCQHSFYNAKGEVVIR
jgi:hypothetical protein